MNYFQQSYFQRVLQDRDRSSPICQQNYIVRDNRNPLKVMLMEYFCEAGVNLFCLIPLLIVQGFVGTTAVPVVLVVMLAEVVVEITGHCRPLLKLLVEDSF